MPLTSTGAVRAACTTSGACIKLDVMAKLTVWKLFTTAVDGRRITGSWTIEDGIVRVKTLHGEKAAQIRESDPIWLAARLACELAANVKKESGPIASRDRE
jgi:hypothetical protein